MSWPEIVADSWSRFAELVELLDRGPAGRPNYVVRGQVDAAWGLTTTLNRQLGPGVAHEHVLSLEAEMQHEFVSQAANYVSAEMLGGLYNKHLQKWSVMQHHGAPTRLLDWTLSPFVAAYFAVESAWDRDGAIWLFHATALDIVMRKAFPDFDRSSLPALVFNEDAPEVVQVWHPNPQTLRMSTQQGCFTVAANPLTSHEHAIARLIPQHEETGGEFLRKIIVPAGQKRDFLRKLRLMNIAAKALFPGVDGLGRSTTELLRLR